MFLSLTANTGIVVMWNGLHWHRHAQWLVLYIQVPERSRPHNLQRLRRLQERVGGQATNRHPQPKPQVLRLHWVAT